MRAVDEICNSLRIKNNVVSYAGTKDKRGVTCQRVALYKVPMERLASVNGWLRGITVGDASYQRNGPFRLGDAQVHKQKNLVFLPHTCMCMTMPVFVLSLLVVENFY